MIKGGVMETITHPILIDPFIASPMFSFQTKLKKLKKQLFLL